MYPSATPLYSAKANLVGTCVSMYMYMYIHVYLYFVAMVLVAYRGEYLCVHCCGLQLHENNMYMYNVHVYMLKYMQYRLMKTKQGQAMEGTRQT